MKCSTVRLANMHCRQQAQIRVFAMFDGTRKHSGIEVWTINQRDLCMYPVAGGIPCTGLFPSSHLLKNVQFILSIMFVFLSRCVVFNVLFPSLFVRLLASSLPAGF